jgi:hypothetical protein
MAALRSTIAILLLALVPGSLACVHLMGESLDSLVSVP